MIVMELASEGSLRAYLDRHAKTKTPLPPRRCLELLLDVARGMKYMHVHQFPRLFAFALAC